MKKLLDLYNMREKIKQRNKVINNKEKIEKSKEKQKVFDSLIKIIKSNNKKNNLVKYHSRTLNHITKFYNNQSSSKSSRKTKFNLTGKNKYLSYQLLKRGEAFLNESSKKRLINPIQSFHEQSRLALLKKISSKILQNQMNQKIQLTNKLNERSNSNYNIRGIMKKRSKFKENNKINFDSHTKTNYINPNRNNKYYEISKKEFNFSDILIVERKKYLNPRKKIKKERKIVSKYVNKDKRPLTALERYYIKFGVEI